MPPDYGRAVPWLGRQHHRLAGGSHGPRRNRADDRRWSRSAGDTGWYSKLLDQYVSRRRFFCVGAAGGALSGSVPAKSSDAAMRSRTIASITRVRSSCLGPRGTRARNRRGQNTLAAITGPPPRFFRASGGTPQPVPRSGADEAGACGSRPGPDAVSIPASRPDVVQPALLASLRPGDDPTVARRQSPRARPLACR